LPDDLVWGTALDHLSDAIDPNWRPAGWNPKRARPAHVCSESWIEEKMLKLLARAPDHRLTRTRLQQGLWRIPARFFHHALGRLIERDRVAAHEGWLYPYSRAELDSIQREAQERYRRPKLLYTIP
jgi:hypothetical protein